MIQKHSTSLVHESTKYRAFLRRLTAATGGGMFLDGYVFATIAAVIAGTRFSQELSLTPLSMGFISSATLMGTIFGGPLIGYLTDIIGRRVMFIIDLCVFLAASLSMLMVSHAWQVVVLGIILGVVIGGDYSIGSPLLGEFAPAHNRGRYLAILEALWSTGYVIAFFIGYVILLLSPNSWHLVLACSAIPAGLILLLRQGLPESPRWLLSKGRSGEAREILTHIDMDNETAEYLLEPVEKTKWTLLFSREYLTRTVFCCVFWICIVVPYFALTFFQSKVLATLGVGNPVLIALIGTLTALVGAVCGWYFIDKIGRRPLIIIPMFVCGSALAIVAIGEGLHFSPVVNVICFFVYLLFYGMMGILPGVYPLEVFPTSVRSSGLGVSSGASRIGAATATFLVPLGFASFGLTPILFILAAVSVIGGIVSVKLAPETARKQLIETGGVEKKLIDQSDKK